MKIALAIFGFNRPVHLQNCLDSLELNTEIAHFPIYIFLDGARSEADLVNTKLVNEISEIFARRNLNVSIRKAEKNYGLRESIIKNLSMLFSEFDAVITIEDDLLVSHEFLKYMQASLVQFKSDKKIGSVSGFREGIFPFYLQSDLLASKRQCCWGWGTWSDRWSEIDWQSVPLESKQYIEEHEALKSIGYDLSNMYEQQARKFINSWSITFDANAARLNWRCLQPRHNFVCNAGMDGSGTHFNSPNLLNKDARVPSAEVTNQMKFYKISFVHDLSLKFSHSFFALIIKRQLHRVRTFFFRYFKAVDYHKFMHH